MSKKLILSAYKHIGDTSKKNLKNFFKASNIRSLIKNIKIENQLTTDQAQNFIINKYNNSILEQRQIKKNQQKNKAFELTASKRILKSQNSVFKAMNQNKLESLVKVLLDNKFKKNKFILSIGGKLWTLTTDLLIKLRSFVNEDIEQPGSDTDIINKLVDISTVKISKLPNKQNQKTFKGGKFFIYEHLLPDIDLTELQIYEKDKFKAEYYNDNCFVKSLRGQIPDEIINNIKLDCPGKHISMKHLKIISEKYKIHIIVSTFNKCENRKRLNHYGKGNSTKVEICLLEDHYFKFCRVPITKYAFENFNDINHLHKWNEIYMKKDNGYFKRRTSNFMSSYDVVKGMLDNKEKYLVEISKNDEIYKTPFFNSIKKIENLNYDADVNTELNVYKPKSSEDTRLVFFDFETKTKGIHEPYMVHIKSEEINKTFYGSDCGLSMLKYICNYFKEKEIKLIAHNLAYDFKFISKHLSVIYSMIERGNSIMSVSGIFKHMNNKLNIKFQDSYALIPDKLSNFGDMFGLDQEKEFIPYNLYNCEDFMKPLNKKIVKKHCDHQVNCNNIGKKVSIEMYEKSFKHLLSNAKKWKCIDGENIDMLKYSQKYCEMDCIILEKGYNKFKKDIKQICDLDIDNYISLASIANEYMLKEGVYDDVYKLNSVPREFIQQCVVGGRTMCANNTKCHVQNKKLDDFDAVSLYPSAMKKLIGYLKGQPKVLQTTNYDLIKNYDGYFVEVLIKKLNIHRDFPLLSYVNEDGVRMFSNDMEGKVVYLDKISLEDAINYQDIEFDIIRGYYYNEGRNNKLEEVITYMFDQRILAKADYTYIVDDVKQNKKFTLEEIKNKENKKFENELKSNKIDFDINPIQNIYKLLMNSSYGKSILKPIEYTVSIKKGKEAAEACILADYEMIKEVTPVDDIYLIKKHKSILDHFNNAPCGVEVLSMSKRIMNEVMCTAEDNNLKIYYQDTDSMHIQSEDVVKLSSLYKQKYNRELIGKNMLQFHTDFSSKILKDEIYAKESIFLGKKCYIDVLTDDSKKIDYHLRMKGVSSDSILHKAQEEHNYDVLQIYKNLFNNQSYNFDLTCKGLKACFNHDNISQISTKTKFTRELKFITKNNY